MGKEKAGFLTPKAIANRIKAKGLQKLKWYCQMCQKQCRDENGFKCHTSSESHQRQLLLFAENPDTYIDTFSREFMEGYCDLLKRRFASKRIRANQVYQEYIAYKEHVHMNSTQWETLTDFVKWLGREGYATVDETEKGWYVAYIDRDPETIRRQSLLKMKEKMVVDDEDRLMRFIERQIERDEPACQPEVSATELQREEGDSSKVVLQVKAPSRKRAGSSDETSAASNPLFKKPESKPPPPKLSKPLAKKPSALGEIMEMEEKMKGQKNLKDYWLHEGIVVKVITKRLGEKYAKRKGVVQSLKDNYTGVVKMIDSGDLLKLDQSFLETVIPALGKDVLVVNGAYRGSKATLLQVSESSGSANLRISSGVLRDRVVSKVPFEHFSKLIS